MTRRTLTLFAAVLAFVSLCAPAALSAEPAAPVGGAKTFKAADTTATKADPNDPLALLAQCDQQLEASKTDAIGMPYLIAAYLILWAILVTYLLLARRGQQALQADLDELRARLRDYEDRALASGTGPDGE